MGEGKYTIVFFDLGGSSSMRKTWKSYLAEVHAVIFVVDAAAPTRFEEACTTLGALLENEQMMGKPLLVSAPGNPGVISKPLCLQLAVQASRWKAGRHDDL